jgi:hypothetical protein
MATTIVRPNSDNSVAWTPLGAGTNHSEVSEASPDGDSTRNTTSDSTSTDVDEFTFANASIPSGDTITSVILTVRARDTGGGSAQINLRVRHDALNEKGGENLSTSYADKTYDVTGIEAWQPADFDGQAITIGYKVGGSSSTRERRVTQVFLTIVHATPMDLRQGGIRWRDDDGNEAGATWHQAQDVDHSIDAADLDKNIRLRFGMENIGGTSESDQWQIEAQTNGTGGWSDVTDVSTNGARVVTSTQVDEGDATTSQMTGLAGSFVAGGIEETNGNESFTLGANEHTEEEFVLSPRSAELSGGDYIEFRLRHVGGETITYDVADARLTINAGAAEQETLHRSKLESSLVLGHLVG